MVRYTQETTRGQPTTLRAPARPRPSPALPRCPSLAALFSLPAAPPSLTTGAAPRAARQHGAAPRHAPPPNLACTPPPDMAGNTALHLAARAGSVELLPLLLASGADPDAPNGKGAPAPVHPSLRLEPHAPVVNERPPERGLLRCALYSLRRT
eukprot:2743954-Prymnesium_polylepis.1